MAQLSQTFASKNWKPCFSSMSQKSKIVFDFFPTNIISLKGSHTRKCHCSLSVSIKCSPDLRSCVFYAPVSFRSTHILHHLLSSFDIHSFDIHHKPTKYADNDLELRSKLPSPSSGCLTTQRPNRIESSVRMEGAQTWSWRKNGGSAGKGP